MANEPEMVDKADVTESRERGWTVVGVVMAALLIVSFVLLLVLPRENQPWIDVIIFGAQTVLAGALSAREFVRHRTVSGGVFALLAVAALTQTILRISALS